VIKQCPQFPDSAVTPLIAEWRHLPQITLVDCPAISWPLWRSSYPFLNHLPDLSQLDYQHVGNVIEKLKNRLNDGQLKSLSSVSKTHFNYLIIYTYRPKVIAALIKALGDNEWLVRQAAAGALGQLKQASPEVIAALMKALGDRHEDVRQAAESALVQLGQASPEVIAALMKALEGTQWQVQQAAAEALGQFSQLQPATIEEFFEIYWPKGDSMLSVTQPDPASSMESDSTKTPSTLPSNSGKHLSTAGIFANPALDNNNSLDENQEEITSEINLEN
jgi:hypothetical protein